MAFDDAGYLYIAETGAHDPPTAGGEIPESNHSGRVVRITPDGHMTTVVTGLPYAYYKANGDVGATDVVWQAGSLYVLTGGGYDDRLSRRVLRIRPNGTTQSVANIENFVINTTPMAEQMRTDNASNPYAMVAAADGSAFYVTDGASGRILRVTLDGKISVYAQAPEDAATRRSGFWPGR